jgi:hypothetical protein
MLHMLFALFFASKSYRHTDFGPALANWNVGLHAKLKLPCAGLLPSQRCTHGLYVLETSSVACWAELQSECTDQCILYWQCMVSSPNSSVMQNNLASKSL